LASKTSKEQLLHLIYELSELSNTIKWSSQKTIMFEAGMINVCMPKVDEKKINNINTQKINTNQNNNETKNENKNENNNENKLESNNVSKQNDLTNNKIEEKKEVKENANNTGSKKEKGVNLPYWSKVIDKIKQNGKMGIYVNLIGSTAKEINDMTVEVILANKNSFAKDVLEAHENKAEIERITSIEAGKTMNVRFVNEESKMENISNNGFENLIGNLDIPINIIDG